METPGGSICLGLGLQGLATLLKTNNKKMVITYFIHGFVLETTGGSSQFLNKGSLKRIDGSVEGCETHLEPFRNPGMRY